jgi:acylphosphatase
MAKSRRGEELPLPQDPRRGKGNQHDAPDSFYSIYIGSPIITYGVPRVKRERLIVSGIVQGVRFRDRVQTLALASGIKGSIMNLKDRTVEIICEGDDDKIDAFKKKLADIKDLPHAQIDKVDSSQFVSEDKFTTFEIKYGSTQEELSEQMGASYHVLLGYDEKLNKLDDRYGTISVNVDAAANAIRLLAESLQKFGTTIEEDRDSMKTLAGKMDKSMMALSSDIRELIKERKK